MSTAASDPLPLPGIPLPSGIARTAGTAIVAVLLFSIAGIHPGSLHGPEPVTTLALAASLTAGCWCAARIWLATIGNASRGSGDVVAFATQVPFWFLGGGIGYCIGVVCLKGWGVIVIQDNPFPPVFFAGAWTGIVAAAAPAFVIGRHSSIISRIRGTHPGKGPWHDKSGTAPDH